MIISFECEGPAMTFFTGKFHRLDEREKAYLSTILREGLIAFDPPIDKPAIDRLERRSPPPYGSEQMIKINLEALFISLVRKEISVKNEIRLSMATKERRDSSLTSTIIEYLQANLSANLSVEQICRHFGIVAPRSKPSSKRKQDLVSWSITIH